MEPVTSRSACTSGRSRLRRSAVASVAAAGATLVVMALGPAIATADHVAGSTKQCRPQNAATQTFNCVLSVSYNVHIGVRATIFVDIEPGPVNAAFASSPRRIGGTCLDAEISQLSPTSAGIGPPLFGPPPTFGPPCTFVLAETLTAEQFGEVCQVVSLPRGNHPERLCAQLRPSRPTTKEQCKDGGWQQYGVFANQGDCVSFVATEGRNEPARR